MSTRALPWYTGVEVDFNRPPDELLGFDESLKLEVGDTVFAFTIDDTQPFGCMAEVTRVETSPNPERNLVVLRMLT